MGTSKDQIMSVWRRIVFLMLALIVGCILILKQPLGSFLNTKTESLDIKPDVYSEQEQLRLSSNLRMMMEQRNNLSRLLNLKQQRLGQVECDLNANNVATSDTGGWCAKPSKENGGQHYTDEKLAVALSEFLSGKLIGSFGDGPGRYKQLLKDSGKIKDYHGFDGAPYCEKTSEGRVQFLDLTLPQYGLPLYDWIISLEVAEHIPQQFESIYIDNVVRHAKEGVILSWAVPGQAGYSHVNNRPFEYIKSLMEGLGFSHDDTSSAKLRSASSNVNLSKNVNVFRRTNINIEELRLRT